MKMPGTIQTEDKHLLRDMHSKALLATDKGALERHRRDRARKRQQTQLEAEVHDLRDTCRQLNARLDELSRLLAQALSGQPHGN